MNKGLRILHIAAALALACIITGTTAGCATKAAKSSQGKSTADEATNCVIVYAQRSNSLSYNSADSEGMASIVEDVKLSGGKLAIVTLDGSPKNAERIEVGEIESKNDKAKKKEVGKFWDGVCEKLQATIAVKPEVDVAKALSKADSDLKKADKEDEEDGVDRKEIVIIVGSCLSTTGVIDFASEDYFTDLSNLDKYAEWLCDNNELGDLSHIDKLVWYGFDAVADPQAEISTNGTPSVESKLEDFYTKVLKDAGVGEVDINTGGSGEKPSGDLPYVSAVKMPGVAKFKIESGSEVKLSADALFDPDKATFLDGTDPTTDDDIKAVANAIKNQNLKVTITGYTAHYGTNSEGGNEGLSKARAEALKQVLVDMGCPEDSITTVGGGFGPYDDDQANRCVVVEFE